MENTVSQWAEILIPISVMLTLFGLFALLLRYQLKKERLFLEMVDRAIQSGAQLTPEQIQSLARPVPRHVKDLRSGMLGVAIAIAIGLFGWIVDMPSGGNLDITRAILGIAGFPATIGLTYLGLFALHRLRQGRI